MGAANQTPGAAGAKGVSGIFGVMSNELNTPKVLYCPSEESGRTAATTFAPSAATGQPYNNDMNVSYFVGVDAQDTYPQMVLTGDHNIGSGSPPTANYQPSATGNTTPFVFMGTNFPTATAALPGWTDALHSRAGNVGIADGSVQQVTRSRLQDQFKNSGDPGCAPNANSATAFTAAPNANPTATAYNRIQFP
jgi:hypothetical protein